MAVTALESFVDQRIDERIAEVMGVINAATAELVTLLATVLREGSWAAPGIRSAEHWVLLHCGVSPERARRLVSLARDLAALPACAAAFAQGSLSEDQAAVVARVPPERDGEVRQVAPFATVPQLRRLVATLPSPEPDVGDDHPVPAPPYAVAFGTNDDGSWWARALLPADEGAVVERAMERARDRLFRERAPQAPSGAVPTRVSWRDALVRVADAGLDGLDSARADGRLPNGRFQVLVHVDADSLAANVHLGDRLPSPVRRYLTCDATVRAVVERKGVPMALSSRSRTVDDRMRALVEERDRGCRVPGCTQRRWLHVHHLVHVEDGGRTSVDNLCCLCPVHHRMHHEGSLRITGDPTRFDGLVCTDARGRILGPAPPRAPDAPPTEAAEALGLHEPAWAPPSGERIQWACVVWPP